MDFNSLQRTKRQISHLLKTAGPLSTAELASQTRTTIAGVRKHLQQMMADGLVQKTSQANGRGRPAAIWELTSLSHASFQDAHNTLSLELLDAARAELGSRALDRLLSERERTIVRRYRKTISRSDPPEQRLSCLAELRTAEGYMAETEAIDSHSWRLRENHCPIADASRSCRGLCVSELQTFRKALGADISIEREDYLHEGSRCCSYIMRTSARTRSERYD